MIQRVFGQIRQAQPNTPITIATNTTQIDSIKNQLGDAVSTILEPSRRDTFPAIALACTALASRGVSREETIVALPCDHYTEPKFFELHTRLNEIISSGVADIALIGIKPLTPTSKYGYIVPKPNESKKDSMSVSHFIEKPSTDKAAELIKKGAFWNGGVFAFKLGYLLDIIGETDFEKVYNNYDQLEKTSFDYKIVEKAKSIAVVPYEGKWEDLGTWRTLSNELSAQHYGNVLHSDTKGCFVINELNIPMITLGVKDLVIAASPDGILVSDMGQSSNVKTVVDKLDARPMFEERRWGEYTVLGQNEYNLVKHLHLLPGKGISYQAHKYRAEIWVITSGEGNVTIDGKTNIVKAGDVLKIEKLQKHKIEAITDLHITEIQLGEKFDESDNEKFEEQV